MTQRLIIIVLSLALGLVSGAFGYSLLSQKRNAKAIAAARAEGRAEAEKAMAGPRLGAACDLGHLVDR